MPFRLDGVGDDQSHAWEHAAAPATLAAAFRLGRKCQCRASCVMAKDHGTATLPSETPHWRAPPAQPCRAGRHGATAGPTRAERRAPSCTCALQRRSWAEQLVPWPSGQRCPTRPAPDGVRRALPCGRGRRAPPSGRCARRACRTVMPVPLRTCSLLQPHQQLLRRARLHGSAAAPQAWRRPAAVQERRV